MGEEPLEEPMETGPAGRGRTHEAVILDLFGTMVDFQSVFVGTLERIIVDNGMVGQHEEFRGRWRRFVFQGHAEGTFVTVRTDFEDSLVSVLDELGVEGDLVAYSRIVIGEMFEQLREADLFPEVPGVIAAIEEEGVPWAIVSNVDEEDLRAIIANQGLRPVVAVSSERVRSYKPDGAIFRSALEELDLPASRVMHVGDSPLADVAGATGAGLSALWVNRMGIEFPGDLPRPLWELPDLSDLPGLLLRE